MAHIVGSRYLGKYFASLTASNRFFSLMAGEFRRRHSAAEWLRGK
jgi:hypothetical protein